MAVKRVRIIGVTVLVLVWFFITGRSRLAKALQAFENSQLKLLDISERSHAESEIPLSLRIDKNAHTLASADDFRLHFKAVISRAGISLTEAERTCTWTQSEKITYSFPKDKDWVKQKRSEEEISKKREEWQKFVEKEMISWDSAKSRFRGRGIVIVAGNAGSLSRIKVMFRALRRVGSKLPIEVHYWGGELDKAARQDLSRYWHDIYFNDLSAKTNLMETVHGIFANHQMKTGALVNSRFEEILLMDSDNIPVIDPEELFECDTYYEFGTIFWPDLARTRPENPIWPISNTRCRMNEYEQESGQVLVDKRQYFYHLQLGAWLNNVQGNYYKQLVLGDKDMLRFSWHMLKTRYGTPKKWLTLVGTLNKQNNGQFFCGHTFAQHHPNGSVAFLHGGLAKTMDHKVIRWNKERNGGIFGYYKRSPYDERHDMIEPAHIKWDGASYMPQDQKPTAIGSCADMKQVDARDLEEILPGFETMYKSIGGYWMLDS